MWPAIVNGYPLVYSDSGTYIISGFLKNVPMDRPIAYGLFINLLGAGTSLWFVVIAQALLVIFTIYMLVRLVTKSAPWPWTIGLVLVPGLTTGVSNYTSQIMPDIFSALSIVGFGVLLAQKKFGWLEVLLSCIVVLSAMFHFSILMVGMGMGIVAIIGWAICRTNFTVVRKAVLLSTLPVLLVLGLNYSLTDEVFISKTSNVFTTARIMETGVLADFLTENCSQNEYLLCNSVNDFPNHAHEFLWNDDSPLYDEDCRSRRFTACWLEKNHHFGFMLKDIVTQPKYLSQLAVIYTVDFFSQLGDFGIGLLTPQTEGSAAQNCLTKVYPSELDAYKSTAQYKETQFFKTASSIQMVMVILGLLGILWGLFQAYRNKTIQNYAWAFMLILGVLGNALSVTIFSGVLDRYQSRVIWILPLIALCILVRYWENRQELTQISNKSNGK
ncbi:MAG: hypothetical protein ACPGU4_02245 [Flavobacteriales bacterium]